MSFERHLFGVVLFCTAVCRCCMLYALCTVPCRCRLQACGGTCTGGYTRCVPSTVGAGPAESAGGRRYRSGAQPQPQLRSRARPTQHGKRRGAGLWHTRHVAAPHRMRHGVSLMVMLAVFLSGFVSYCHRKMSLP